MLHQIQDMYEEIQTTCAECLFSLACQRPLNKADTLQLISYLKGDNSLQADGSLSQVTLVLLMALLYCFDVSVLEREDAEGWLIDCLSRQHICPKMHKRIFHGSKYVPLSPCHSLLD